MIDYRDTLNLPDSKKFSMRANLTACEPIILENWNKDNLYEIIRYRKSNNELFLLHDGPIYANGNIHLGHAVNRILKDFILKFKGLMGFNAPYIPGWDCHGLPIELQVERLINHSNISVSSKKFRDICRCYVLEQIEMQKKDFMRLGILGDWNHPYLTMDFKISANIVRTLGKIISNNYLYRGSKPVYWCFKCCSVLSDSEVEYVRHSSPSVYITFKSEDNFHMSKIFDINLYGETVELVIWTTTPWTLPANQAIAVHPDYVYKLIKINNNRHIIIVSDLVNSFIKHIKCVDWKILGSVLGSVLEFSKFRHPFMKKINVPIILSHHVSCNVGTGVVHVAPNYGIDDYIIGKKYSLKFFDVIDDHGCYMLNTHPVLDGIQIFQSNNLIIELLRKSGSLLFYSDSAIHSYPYCWRHAVPIIFRVTTQWFVSMDKNNLRDQLLQSILQVNWITSKSKFSMQTMVKNRPDWCLSRQRSWGVPIPIFINKNTGDLHPRTCEFIKIIAKLIENDGVQVWWDLQSQDIMDHECDQYEKVLDTLDVWFDSGSTYDSVISERYKQCKRTSSDLYLEGSDQYRGWFMSSLVLSTAIQGIPPYKEVLSHGFITDAQGRKMSKSIGNVISPQEIIKTFGADILRLWVAFSDYSKDMTISDLILQRTIDMYRRIRNTARFCLVNLSDFNPYCDKIFPESMVALDRWAVNKALSVQSDIILNYNKYNFHNVMRRVVHFCSVEMSAFYFDIIKDRQYTTKKNGNARRSCQTALYHIIEAMVRWIAPVLSFTANEIWECIPGERSKYVFTEKWYDGLFSIDLDLVMNDSYWNTFLSVKNAVNKKIEKERINGLINSSLESCVFLYVTPRLAQHLNILKDELSFGLITSSVEILNYDDKQGLSDQKIEDTEISDLKIAVKKAQGHKCARCWHYKSNVGQNKNYLNICKRCIDNMVGLGEIRRFF